MLVNSIKAMVDLTEQELQSLYAWIDEVPLSRPKRNIARDFSDAVMAAEIIDYFFPRLVEMHNYSAANSTQQKLENWRLLNRKVFNKMDMNVSDDLLQSVVVCKPGVIEYILDHLKSKIEHFQKTKGPGGDAEFNPLFGRLSEQYSFNTTAGNTVMNQIQDSRHTIAGSPTPSSSTHQALQQRQSSINLPPLVKSPLLQRPSKLPKPSKPSVSHIPRPTESSCSTPSKQGHLPPINSQSGHGGSNSMVVNWGGSSAAASNNTAGGGAGQNTTVISKLPVSNKEKTGNKHVKSGGGGIQLKSSKRDLNYASQHLGVASHWFRKQSNAKDNQSSGLSKEGLLVMAEKDQMIMELQETVQLLQMKVKRLEHLIKIKDYKLQDIEKQASSQIKR